MDGRFFITGLPRSRTAWLSVLADGVPGALCVHEPTAWLSRWEDVGTIWGEPWLCGEREHVGVADSCLGLHAAEVLKLHAPRTLIVDRPLEDVATSLARASLPVSMTALQVLKRRLDAVRDHPLARVVDYARLNDVEEVCRALEFLLPGAVIDSSRAARLVGMNIQTSVADAKADAERIIREGRAADVLGADVIREMEAA